MIMGHISNVWSIKPNFKFKTPKCDQNFPAGGFLILLRVMQHSVRSRVVIAVKIRLVCRCGGGVVNFSGCGVTVFWTLMMRKFGTYPLSKKVPAL